MKTIIVLFITFISFDIFSQSRIINVIKSDTFFVEKVKVFKKVKVIYAKNNLNQKYKIIYESAYNFQNIKKHRYYLFELRTISFEVNGKPIDIIPNRTICREIGKEKICTEPQNGIGVLYDLLKFNKIHL